MKKFKILMDIVKNDGSDPKTISLTVDAGTATLAVSRAIREARESSLAPRDKTYINVRSAMEVH